jgi:hypothetical protein
MEPALEIPSVSGEADKSDVIAPGEDEVKSEPDGSDTTPAEVSSPLHSPALSIASDTESDCSSLEDSENAPSTSPLFSRQPHTPPQKETREAKSATRKRGLQPQSPRVSRDPTSSVTANTAQRPQDSALVRTTLSPIKSQQAAVPDHDSAGDDMDTTDPAEGSQDMSLELDSPLNRTINPALVPQNIHPHEVTVHVQPAEFARIANLTGLLAQPLDAPHASITQGNYPIQSTDAPVA